MASSNSNYRRLLSEKKFLRVAERAGKLTNSRLVSIEYNETLLRFKTESGTHPGKLWTQEVRILDMIPHMNLLRTAQKVSSSKERGWHVRSALKKNPLTTKEIDRVLLNSPIKIHCDCPAYLYWGYRYIGTRLNYSLYPIHKRPTIRNPHQQGYVCKHLYRVLSVWPYISNVVTRALIKKGIIAESYPSIEAAREDYMKRNNLKSL